MAYEFHYDTVQLYKTQVLGTGSNGTVCRAKCDDLPCAAKILHHALFQFNDPGAMRVVQRFQQECDFLSEIRHPHIVQYLGTYGDPEFKLPVLLMELMDESLTQFLERSQEPLHYHTQVDILYNIALALSHLHRNDIIHRDLSSNNVLVTAGTRAKITDFGMARLFDINHSIPMTMCPGTQAYMSPEALDDPPIYTKKLDCFSFGVLDIQIVTRLFPDPEPHTKKVRDSRSPTGIMDMPVLETDRRKAHIDLINSTHPLLPTAIDCLSYSEEDRPSTQELCQRLAALKEAPQYSKSLQQAQEERSAPAKSAVVDEGQLKKLQQEIEELQREKNKHIQSVQQQGEEKGTTTDAKEAEIQRLQDEKFVQAVQENGELRLLLAQKDSKAAAREMKLQTLIQKLKENEQATARLHETIAQKEKTIQDQQNRWIKHLEQQHRTGNSKETNRRNIQLSWRENAIARAPCDLYRGAAAAAGQVAYFNNSGSRTVFAYDAPTEQWSTLPYCPQHSFALVVVNDFLTTVGGDSSLNTPTNALFSLTEEGKNRNWSQKFPPMRTPRYCLAAVCTGTSLIVAGGKTSYTNSDIVEVMDTNTLQWSVASSLPHPFVWVSAAVCGDHIYMLGGSHHSGTTKSVLTCSLAELLYSCQKVSSAAEQPTVWQNVASLPVYHSTCATIHGQLLAVGGCDEDSKSSSAIRKYNPTSDSWEIISHMAITRYKSLAAVLPKGGLIVVGGLTAPFEYISAVEIANVI